MLSATQVLTWVIDNINSLEYLFKNKRGGGENSSWKI